MANCAKCTLKMSHVVSVLTQLLTHCICLFSKIWFAAWFSGSSWKITSNANVKNKPLYRTWIRKHFFEFLQRGWDFLLKLQLPSYFSCDFVKKGICNSIFFYVLPQVTKTRKIYFFVVSRMKNGKFCYKNWSWTRLEPYKRSNWLLWKQIYHSFLTISTTTTTTLFSS